MQKIMIKTHRELLRFKTFEERYNYLRLSSSIGQPTFGYDRYLNQMLYGSQKWKRTRDNIIIRDDGCDLGDGDYRIHGRIIVHHMNPITIEDVEEDRDVVYDPDSLICTTHNTHNAIHYGDASLLPQLPNERRPNDTCPWR